MHYKGGLTHETSIHPAPHPRPSCCIRFGGHQQLPLQRRGWLLRKDWAKMDQDKRNTLYYENVNHPTGRYQFQKECKKKIGQTSPQGKLAMGTRRIHDNPPSMWWWLMATEAPPRVRFTRSVPADSCHIISLRVGNLSEWVAPKIITLSKYPATLTFADLVWPFGDG